MRERNNPLLFFNVGWMLRYQGNNRDDKIIGGGRWVVEHDFGEEVCNFLPWRGWCYGYVQPSKKSDHIKIERLGADKNAEELADVTIVWTATRPGGGTVVVGWYRHATVYRHSRAIKDRTDPRFRRFKITHYYAKAKVADCHIILDPDDRVLEIPRVHRGGNRRGMGQSNVWFAEDSHGENWFKRLARAIGTDTDPKPPKNRSRKKARKAHGGMTRQSDPELRMRVEKAAIESTWEYFEKKGYAIEDRQRAQCGWDLTCCYGRRELHVEVKGASGGNITAELTANEFALFGKCKPNYRLAVVTSALTRPKVHCFSWDMVSKRWIANTNAKLRVQEVISAVVREA